MQWNALHTLDWLKSVLLKRAPKASPRAAIMISRLADCKADLWLCGLAKHHACERGQEPDTPLSPCGACDSRHNGPCQVTQRYGSWHPGVRGRKQPHYQVHYFGLKKLLLNYRIPGLVQGKAKSNTENFTVHLQHTPFCRTRHKHAAWCGGTLPYPQIPLPELAPWSLILCGA